MKIQSLKLGIAALLMGSCWGVSAEIQVKSGDKIAFMGDSITQMGNRKCGYLNLVMSALEVNGVKAVKIPAGVSGNKSTQMKARLQRAVLDKKPQIMTLSCGVNDVWHLAFKRGVALPQYQQNMTDIIDRAQKQGIKVYLLTATMIFENPQHQFNKKLIPYNAFLRQLAQEKKCVLVDLNATMQKELQAFRQKYPMLHCNYFTVDGVHMNPRGDMMLATEILRAFGLTDAQIKKAWPVWKKKPFYRFGLQLSVGQYIKLSDRAYSQKKTPTQYISEVIKKELAH